MNYRERMKEYLKEPDEHSSNYGKWAILNKEQKDLIKRLLREMDGADEVIKHQYFEIEKLKELSKVDSQQGQEIIIEQNKEIERLQNIIKEVREYIEEKYEYILKDDKFLDHDERIDRKQILHILEILDKGE